MSELKIEDVAAAIKSHVEGKADAEALEAVKSEIPSIEGLAKTADLEGFVKSEEVVELKEALATEKAAREELAAIVKAAPAVTKGASVMDGQIKLDNYEGIKGSASFNLSGEFNKSFAGTGSTAQVTGSMTDMQRLYYQMQQKNPYRGLSTILPTSGGSVNLPQVTAITAAVENTITNTSAQFSSAGGNITTTNVIPQNWVSRTAFSDQSVEDLPGLDSMVASFMAQQIARAEAGDMVGQLDAATISEVNTGVAAGNPTSITVWADLVAELDSAYRDNAMFVMSRAAYASLRSLSQSGTGSDLVLDPATGMQTLWSYPIVINDHHDDGTTAADNSVYFGDFSMGTTIVSRKEMNLSRHEDTLPGAMYYYGNMRSRGVVWDANALVRFNTAV